jgi:hypothetical protein
MLPYLSHFRVILHIWNTEEDGTEWASPEHEVMYQEVWDDHFLLRSKLQKELHNLQFSRSNTDYAKEILNNTDILDDLVSSEFKNEVGEKYFEVIGIIGDRSSDTIII